MFPHSLLFVHFFNTDCCFILAVSCNSLSVFLQVGQQAEKNHAEYINTQTIHCHQNLQMHHLLCKNIRCHPCLSTVHRSLHKSLRCHWLLHFLYFGCLYSVLQEVHLLHKGHMWSVGCQLNSAIQNRYLNRLYMYFHLRLSIPRRNPL